MIMKTMMYDGTMLYNIVHKRNEIENENGRCKQMTYQTLTQSQRHLGGHPPERTILSHI